VWVALAAILFVAAILGGLISVAARWGRELLELQQHGVETTGVVIDKVRYRQRGAESRYLRYEYVDPFGRAHRRKVLVTAEAWDTHERGGAIAVIYSARRPRVSAPKYLIDVAARSFERRV
jgi:hypothetical protein